jgi:hypothetical protein
MMNNPFAQIPGNQEAIVAQVAREAEEEWHTGRLPAYVLDPCVREAVDTLWASEIKTFVPLLALRRVRACLRAGTCDTFDW